MRLDRDDEEDDAPFDPEAAVELPIDGVLDLHGFQPREVKELVPEYLAECRGRSILEVRIIHGKGDGTLRRIVHAALDRLDFVKAYALAGHDAGGWGATRVDLLPRETDSE
jgi:DNA-nicking Smr family endonuclease